jgi:hypothetical protein
MKKLTSIVDCKNKILTLMFQNEKHVIDLREGDLHDNWNAFTDKNSEVWDVNFTWEDTTGEKPYLSIYPVLQNEDGTFPENSTQWDEDISFKVKKIGTRDEYFREVRFGYRFDSSLPLKFEVFDSKGVVILKTKSGNKASDEAYYRLLQFNDQCVIVATDSNGATRKL